MHPCFFFCFLDITCSLEQFFSKFLVPCGHKRKKRLGDYLPPRQGPTQAPAQGRLPLRTTLIPDLAAALATPRLNVYG